MLHKWNYREILKSELSDRILKNPSYSLRAMSRQIDVSASMLSAVLQGKKGFSVEKAMHISKALKMNATKGKYFVTLVEYETVKSEETRNLLEHRLHAMHSQFKAQAVDLDIFNTIAEWYHIPILEMSQLDGFAFTLPVIAESLGISENEAKQALDRLCRLKLLSLNDKNEFVKTDSQSFASSPTPNEALRHFHRQMLSKAIHALKTQTNTEKFIGSETFAFDQEDLEKANEAIEECFSKITHLAEKSKNKKHIYHLGIQLFKLSRSGEGQ